MKTIIPSLEDDYAVIEQCSERIKKVLQEYYDELEGLRDAINDRWPWPNLFLKMEEVDSGEYLVENLLIQLDLIVKERKEIKKKEHNKYSNI